MNLIGSVVFFEIEKYTGWGHKSERVTLFYKKIFPSKIYKNGYKLFKLFVTKKVNQKQLSADKTVELKKRFKPNVIRLNKLLHDNNLIQKDINLVNFWKYDKL